MPRVNNRSEQKEKKELKYYSKYGVWAYDEKDAKRRAKEKGIVVPGKKIYSKITRKKGTKILK